MLQEQVARQAAQECGYKNLQVIRVARTAVFKSGNQAVKVTPLTWRTKQQVAQEHNLMEWLLDRGFPCPQQQSSLEEASGMIVVAYELLEPAENLDWEEFGSLIKQLHSLTPPHSIVSETAALNARNTYRKRIQQEPLGLSEKEKSVLQQHVSEAEQLLQHEDQPVVLCHGDAHPGNLLQGQRGLVLIDFEKAGLGPPQVDLATAYARAKRFGLPQDTLNTWLAGYGSCQEDQLTEAFQMLSEVGGILYLSGAADPSLKAEARKRIRVLSGDSQEIWQDR